MVNVGFHSVGKCKAKDPSVCRFHGVPVSKGALGLYRKYVAKQVGVDSNDRVSEGLPVDVALGSSLGWGGVKPVWFDGFVGEAEGREPFGCTPELLDVVSSPLGDVAVVWEDFSGGKGDVDVMLDGGARIRYLSYRLVGSGEVVGYVKLASVDEGSFKFSFGDDEFAEFRFQERYGDGNYNFNDYSQPGFEGDLLGYRNLSGDVLLEKRREVWLAAHRDEDLVADAPEVFDPVTGGRLFSHQLSERNIPSDAKVAADLEVFRSVVKLRIEENNKAKAVPFIDYSFVHAGLRGKGFGAGLYVFAARRLAKDGLCLRSSGMQSVEAKTLWGRFKSFLPDNVGSVSYMWRERLLENLTLDFRI